MRGCVRSSSRRQRRPQHPREPSAGPASARPAAAAALSVPATVSPKQLPLSGQAKFHDCLLLSFLLLFQLLLLPLPSRCGKPLTQLTLARLRTVSSALYLAAPAALRQSCRALHLSPPATSLGFWSAPPPRSTPLELRPSALAGQWPSPLASPSSRVLPLLLRVDDAEDALV